MSSAQEDKIMITKDSLNKAKETVNLASFTLKQCYSNSSSSKKVYFIIEGKDDIPFYGTKADEYLPDGWSLKIIPAGNRKKAVDAYRESNWSIYEKKRVLFFIDRDLSDYTSEDTPSDYNVYVTQKYAIENELCTYDTFIKALKYYYGLNDMEDIDESTIEHLFSTWWVSFSKLAEPIMAQILYWKFNNVNSNYANFKIQNVFEIKDSALQRDKLLTSDDDIIKELFRQSGITYTPIDTTTYKTLLNVRHTPEEYIRGKYVLAFFVKALLYISQNSTTVLPSKKSSRPTINVGYEDAVAKLCGIMRTPESLRTFFENMNKNLQK